MSDEEELELQALERELDDAFATTRPRAGYEDELWLRMQAQRPAPNKIRDAFAGFFQGIRAVPAVPAAAVAAVLVVAIGVGFLVYSGVGLPHMGGATSAPSYLSDSGAQRVSGSFGRLPTPVFNPLVPSTGAVAAPAKDTMQPSQTPYFGPATLTWAGQLKVTISSAPVFRYREPSSSKADEFAAALGAAPDKRSAGYLGSYSTKDYTLLVRGTVQSPPQSPAYFIDPVLLAPVAGAGAGPADIAAIFLAEHGLTPQWQNTVVVKGTSDKAQVFFIRQFDASGYGPAKLIDSKGEPVGLEVELNGNQVVRVLGLLPINLDSANYPIISSDRAIRGALTPSPTKSAFSAPGPSVQLTKAELSYVLAPAGDHSFYEPAYLFSGTFQMNGTTYVMRILVPAVDPSQRS